MSRTASYFHHASEYLYRNLRQRSLPTPLWTESLDISPITISKMKWSAWPEIVIIDYEFDISLFIDEQAASIVAELHTSAEQLVQASLVSRQKTHTPLLTEEEAEPDQEDDIWADIPPLSTKKVKMRARYAGQGEPLDVLGPLAED